MKPPPSQRNAVAVVPLDGHYTQNACMSLGLDRTALSSALYNGRSKLREGLKQCKAERSAKEKKCA